MVSEEKGAVVLSQSERFLKKAYVKALIPSALSILSGCVNIIVDGVLVGQRVGVDGLAAINLCLPVYLVLCVLGSFFVSGTAITAAQEIGRGEMDKAQSSYELALGSCLLASVFATVAGIPLMPLIARLLSTEESVRELVRIYGEVTLAGAVTKIMIYIPFWFLRLEGKNRAVTVMMLLMGGGNVLLDFVFMYWLSWGVFGAALASVIATGVAALFGFVMLSTGKTNFKLRPRLKGPKQSWGLILRSGVPAALNNLLQCFRVIAINAILYRMGGSTLVAVFTVINGIAAFAEAVTVGAPQAGSAMLGVYHGERDNGSAKILLKLEWWYGLAGSVAFAVLMIAGSQFIQRAYGISGLSMSFPFLCLGVSLIPGLANNILTTFYTVSNHAHLSNLIIACRVFFHSVLMLWLCRYLGLNIWLFLPLTELVTLLVWLVSVLIIHRKKPALSPFLLMDTELQRSGRVINFSVPGAYDDICVACEKISDFCADNGMSPKDYMKVSLSMEELMTLILNENPNQKFEFDLRVFSLQGVIGIRIRYGGRLFDPVHEGDHEGEGFMGFRMIEKLVQDVIYRQTFGVNNLIILL